MSSAQNILVAQHVRDVTPASAETFLARSRGRVLIVDDDEAVRETLADLLEFAGFRPVQARNAAEALAILDSDPAIEAIVTDLSMPGMDGIGLIQQAREARNGLPAILLTGYAEQVDATATIAGYDFCVLRKPIDGDQLAGQLDRLVAALPILE